jgi:hypothetical protein
MNILSWVGNFSLNISLVLYFIVYIPQIIHNQKANNIAGLSLWLHGLLYFSYLFDVLYGFASSLPLQYKIVSIAGLLLVIIQHIQLLRYFIHQKSYRLVKIGILFFLASFMILYIFFNILSVSYFSLQTVLIFGAIAQVCGLIYCMPQIVKNKYVKSTRAISMYFVYLNLFIAILDTTSAWCLNWGWPNKFAAPVNIFFMLIMLWQHKQYSANSFLFSYRKKEAYI